MGPGAQLQAPGRPAFYFCSCTLSYLLIISPQSSGVFVGVRVPLDQSSPGHQAQKKTPGRRRSCQHPREQQKPQREPRAGAEPGCVLHTLIQAHLPWQPPSRATPLTLRQPPNPQHSPGGLVNNLSYLPQRLTGQWAGRGLQSPSSDPSTCSTAPRSRSPTPHPLMPGPEQGKEIPEGPSSLLSTANPGKSLPAWSEPQSSDKRKQLRPWPCGWVGWSVIPCTEWWRVRFLVRGHVQVSGSIPGWGMYGGGDGRRAC